MREAGTILKVVGQRVEIDVDQKRPEACATCRACEVLGKSGKLVLRITAEGSYRVGQKVTVETPDVSPWVGIILVLGLPVVMLVAGTLIGGTWPVWINLVHLDAELAGALLGVIAGGLAFMVARRIERRYACRIQIHPLTQDYGELSS